MKQPKKAAVIGFDAGVPDRILHYVKEEVLPAFARLIKDGLIFENCLVPHPTITPPNWTTLATGSWPGTHGITDFHVHIPGNPIDASKLHQGFIRDDCLVENVWETAERAGKKSIVLNWPASWPSRLKKGIVVGGNSNLINDWRGIHVPSNDGEFALSGDQLFSTVVFAKGVSKAEFGPAREWRNLPNTKGEKYLEAEANLSYRQGTRKMQPTTWYFLLEDSQGKGYDTVVFTPARDYKSAFCRLKVGKWSGKCRGRAVTESGEEKEGDFHAKLIELSADGSQFRLYMTGLSETTGFTSPPEVAQEISDYVKEGDCSLRGGGLRAWGAGWIDTETHLEAQDMQHIYFAEAAEYLLKNKEWDIFYMHAHAPDWIYHAWMTELDPVRTADAATNKKYQEHEKKIWVSLDRMLGRILKALGEDTLVALVSDHGAVASGDPVPLLDAFIQKGLIALDPESAAQLRKHPSGEGGFESLHRAKADWSKVKAMPQRAVHIYVNLKGRDPDGIVEPDDYDKVRQEVIDCLMTYVDPKTGKRPFALALRKEDARPLGCYGDRVGDVIYAIYPWFGGQHGNILPTAKWGLGSLHGLLLFSGPGIKKGKTLSRTAWITDVVPTLCYALNLPVPEAVEGAVLFQIFENPNFKQEETMSLRETLANMEKTLAGQGKA